MRFKPKNDNLTHCSYITFSTASVTLTWFRTIIPLIPSINIHHTLHTSLHGAGNFPPTFGSASVAEALVRDLRLQIPMGNTTTRNYYYKYSYK